MPKQKEKWCKKLDIPALLVGLMIQEQIYDAKASKKTLYIVLVTVKTTSDVVWHNSLL